ncbi:MAG: hypothetical protein QOJ58_3848 [Alphaproteobacteria bacterium]|nr:hypothetical protein [Alphaproteobacteria bacterium]
MPAVAYCASVMAALSASRGVGADVRVLIHDFSEDRRYYDPVLELYEVVERVNTLCMMRPKASASASAAVAMMLDHLSDPR